MIMTHKSIVLGFYLPHNFNLWSLMIRAPHIGAGIWVWWPTAKRPEWSAAKLVTMFDEITSTLSRTAQSWLTKQVQVNPKQSSSVIMENVSRLCELQAHLVGYPAVWCHLGKKGVAGFGEPSPFAGLAHHGRSLGKDDQRPQMLHSNIISVISCGSLTIHSGSVTT